MYKPNLNMQIIFTIKYISMKINIGVIKDNRQNVANELTKLLADEYVLYTKTKNAHLNIEGIEFYDKHKFFEMQFERIS